MEKQLELFVALQEQEYSVCKPKLIKSLGHRAVGKQGRTVEFWQVECTMCFNPYDVRADSVRSGKSVRCNSCGHIVTGRKKAKKAADRFIQDARNVHGEKYSYDKVKYVTNRTKVTIYCNSCNEYFEQRPEHHIVQKSGCGNCMLACDNDTIYIWRIKGTNTYKIGITSKRLGMFRIEDVAAKTTKAIGSEITPDVEIICHTANAKDIETYLHARFIESPLEDYSGINGYTEFKTMSREDVSEAIIYISNKRVTND